MVDTYNSTYGIPKKTSVKIDEVDTDVAGYLNTCDSCQTCPDEATGRSSDKVWEDGLTKLYFTPHLDFSTKKYVKEGETRQFRTKRGAPSWEDAGGFYFKRRSSKIKVSPDAPSGEIDKVCMYLIKCNYTVTSSSQILNFFRGGPDRMLFLALDRNTDEAFCDQAWPDSSDGRKCQYFYFWRGIGDTAGDVYSSTLPQTSHTGHFYFLAKAHDTISLEWWDHATRSLDSTSPGSLNRAVGDRDRYVKRVNCGKEENGVITENGPAYAVQLQNTFSKEPCGHRGTQPCGPYGLGYEHDLIAYQSPIASRWGQKARADTPHVQQVERNTFSIVAAGDSYSSQFFTSDGNIDHADYYSCTYDTNNYSLNMYDPTFLYPPTYGWHSVHDLSLGGADAPNQDWELAKKKQDGLSDYLRADWGHMDAEDLCNVQIELRKKLVVIPQIAVNDEYEIPLGSSYGSFVGIPTVDGSKQKIDISNHYDGMGDKISLTQKGRTEDILLSENSFHAKLGKNMNVAGRIGGIFSNGEGFTKANSTIIPFINEGN